MAVPDQELTDFPSPNKLIPFSFQNLILLWISSLTLNLLFWLGYCLPIYYIPSCSKPLPGLELSSLIFLPLFWSFLIFFLSPDSPFPHVSWTQWQVTPAAPFLHPVRIYSSLEPGFVHVRCFDQQNEVENKTGLSLLGTLCTPAYFLFLFLSITMRSEPPL